MATMQCNACGGIYESTMPNGQAYFHACPPLSEAELTAAVAAGAVVLPAGETVKDALRRRTYVRQNARNENVSPSSDPATPATIVSAGAGVTVVADTPIAAPVVVANG